MKKSSRILVKLASATLAVIGTGLAVLSAFLFFNMIDEKINFGVQPEKTIVAVMFGFLAVGIFLDVLAFRFFGGKKPRRSAVNPNATIFKSDNSLKAKTFLKTLILSGIWFSLLSAVLWFFFSPKHEFINPLYYIGMGLAAGIIFALFIACYYCNITVAISSDGMKLLRGGRVYMSFTENARFRTRDLSYQTGFMTFTNRSLIVERTVGKDKAVPLHCISKDDFLIIARLLNTNERETAPKVANAINENLCYGDFIIPKAQILEAKRKDALKEFIIVLIPTIICSVILYFLVSPFSAIFVIPVVIFAWFFGIGNDYSLAKKRTPEEIKITGEAIYIDGERFDANDISEIVMTSESPLARYAKFSYRELTIRTKTGFGKVFLLGSGDGAPSSKMIFHDCEFLSAVVHNWCAKNGVYCR